MSALFAHVRRRLTFANVTSGIALFVALGGTSYAAVNSIGSADLRTGAVGKSEIRTGAVGKSEIVTRAVGKSEVATNAVGKSEIAKDAVDTIELKDGGIELADLSAASRAAFTPGRAAVTSTGTAAGGNAKSVARTATGVYSVEFDRDVSGCQYSATPAAVKNGATVEPAVNGRISVAPGDPNTKVTVSTFGADGTTATDAPFHLIVIC